MYIVHYTWKAAWYPRLPINIPDAQVKVTSILYIPVSPLSPPHASVSDFSRQILERRLEWVNSKALLAH